MPSHILILEDDAERLSRFEAVLGAIAAGHVVRCWRNAHQMVRECGGFLESSCLICLDHDLDSAQGETEDPGDGLDVARYLAPRRPQCPVIIHTSNGDRATRMLGEFQLGGWNASTILPLGKDWIERYWRERVLAALNGRGD